MPDRPSDQRAPWTNKNPWVAGICAYLIPGLGHLYQGRHFKGVLYFVCIMGTFFGGMQMGDWSVVYYAPQPGKISLHYLPQLMAGLPALPAYFQAKRYDDPENQDQHELTEPIAAPFEGKLLASGPGSSELTGDVVGRIELEPVTGPLGPEMGGRFTGLLDGEQEITFELGGRFWIDRPIAASPGRMLEAAVVTDPEEHPNLQQELRGTIPRAFFDRFEVPPDTAALQQLNGRLGKFYELAMVYTWIAGLLNILAIWDAVEGPAYGYGDEEPDQEDSAGKQASKKSTNNQLKAAAAAAESPQPSSASQS